MSTFYLPHQQIPSLRRALEGRPELEIEEAERAFIAYLDVALRVYEATRDDQPHTETV